MSQPRSLSSNHEERKFQLPLLNLEVLRSQHGLKKMEKKRQYSTTQELIELSREQILYNDSLGSCKARQTNKSGFHRIAQISQRTNQDSRCLSIDRVNPSTQQGYLSPLISPLLSKTYKIYDGVIDNKNTSLSERNSPKQPQKHFFNQEINVNMKEHEVYAREMVNSLVTDMKASNSELKMLLSGFGVKIEIFTFYMLRFLEISLDEKNKNSHRLFFKINDFIYNRTIEIFSEHPQSKEIIPLLHRNKCMIVGTTLLEQVCSKDILKSIITRVFNETRNATCMSEFFTADKQLNIETAILAIEEAFQGRHAQIQETIIQIFGKNKFTHVFFFFIKNSLSLALKKQGIPRQLMFRVLEKVESFRYVLVEAHECEGYRNEIYLELQGFLMSQEIKDRIQQLERFQVIEKQTNKWIF